MIPGSLISVYEEYIKDSNSVAAWLASTAKAAGCSPSLLGLGPPTSSRLKGKARKLAQSTKPPPDSNRCIIAVDSLIPLAEYIAAQSNPPIVVPMCLISAIDRAILARTGYAVHLTASQIEDNRTYSHFVMVMRRIRDILRPKVKPCAQEPPFSPHPLSSNRNTDKPGMASKNQADAPRANRHWMNPHTPESGRRQRPEPVGGDPNTYEVEQKKGEQDAYEVLFMLYSDLESIRYKIVSAWLCFQDDFWDLSAAALASNTGMDLARLIIRQVEPIFEPHGGLVKFSELFSSILSPVVVEIGDHALGHRYYVAATQLIKRCLYMVQDEEIEEVTGRWGRSDPTATRESMTAHEKIGDDCRLLGSMFMQSFTLDSSTKGLPVMDEFTREVGRVVKAKRLSFFLIFAGQVILDINHHVQKDALKAFNLMKEELRSMDRMIESYFSTSKQIPKETMQQLRNTHTLLKSTFEGRQGTARSNNTGRPSPYEAHYIYKLSPVLCGLTIFHFRAKLYEFSTQATTIAVVQELAHLHHALRSEGMLNTEWEDLKAMEMRLGASAMFNCASASLDQKPQGIGETFKSLALQKGTSLSVLKRMMSPANERLQLSYTKGGKSCFASGAPLSRLFMDRYVNKPGRVDMKPEDLEKILSLIDFEVLHREDGLNIGIVMCEKGQSSVLDGNSKPAKNPNVALHVLVSALGEQLNKESLILSFPFLVVENQCYQFLLELSTSCSPLTVQKFGSTGFGSPETAASIALFIMLCNYHGLPIGKDMYRLAANKFGKKLSTTWGGAGLGKTRKIWHAAGSFGKLAEIEDDDILRLIQIRDSFVLRQRAVVDKTGTFPSTAIVDIHITSDK